MIRVPYNTGYTIYSKDNPLSCHADVDVTINKKQSPPPATEICDTIVIHIQYIYIFFKHNMIHALISQYCYVEYFIVCNYDQEVSPLKRCTDSSTSSWCFRLLHVWAAQGTFGTKIWRDHCPCNRHQESL